MNRRIVLDTGPIIAFGKIGAFDLIKRLPFRFITPKQVQTEIAAGTSLGYSVDIPRWIEVVTLLKPLSRITLANLDAGGAAVIETALQLEIPLVCIDELKGRRAAAASGLTVLGYLGILGNAKTLRLIETVRPLIQKAQDNGIYYDRKLVERILKGIGE